MREILFRGIRVDNGEWIYGDVVQFPTHGIVRIVEQEPSYKDAEVDSETVGQYTGLTDKNGKKIFEGDIVQEDDVIHNGEIQIKGKVGSISLEKSCFVVLYNDTWDFLQTNAKVVLVVGNIYDNPELLEETE